jgi:hypothetical protein
VTDVHGLSTKTQFSVQTFARKVLIAFWRMVTVGEIPAGFALRQPA